MGVGGQPVLLELDSSARALAAHLGELLTGLLLDAVATDALSRRPRDGGPAGWWNGSTADRPAESVDAGAGELFALDTEPTVVRGVAVDHAWAHLSAFNRQQALFEVA